MYQIIQLRPVALSVALILASCATEQAAQPGSTPPASSARPPGPVQAERSKLATQRKAVLEQGQADIATFWAGDLGAFHQRFHPVSAEQLPLDNLRTIYRQLVDIHGGEAEVFSEGTQTTGIRRSFWRNFRDHKQASTQRFTILYDAQGQLLGFFLAPMPQAQATEHLDTRPKTKLRIPWEDEWYIAWGGTDADRNYHVIARDQRFAMDAFVVKEGKSFRTTGASLEDYYAFGKHILAPADGTVVVAHDGEVDQPIDTTNSKVAMGNHVLIDHGNGEFTAIAHLKQGSVSVAVGDKLVAGTVVGQCGNSGNTSEPHLHMHLQTTGVPFEGNGLPLYFERASVNGEEMHDVMLLKGQLVSSIEPER